MATTEAPTSVEGDPGSGLVYDGFLSYSHAADDLLAPRLQAGLQRFAKPWWKRRSLRIFRDEASLTANPHLWASISDALDESSWFVLLLSPDAAQSEWVNREVEYWLEHKDPRRIIPVLTEGDFGWADGDLVSNASPPALAEVFSDEPRWVDLRFARTEEQLDRSNASFRAAVADIASAIRGVPKDELESEEVRQHRRTIRSIWAAGIALLLLAVGASAAAVYAIGQRNEATLFARQVLDNASFLENSAASPPGRDFVRADQRNIPLPVEDSAPASARMDFLTEVCFTSSDEVESCRRDADFIRGREPSSTNVWLAYEPFHVRHGFVNDSDSPLGSSFPPDFDIELFITRTDGPPLENAVFEVGRTHRFTSDYLIREATNRCGPGYRTLTQPQPCDLFVHDFPDGLPPGRYTFWVEWRAPCSGWTIADVCDDPDTVLSLFASQANTPFFHDDFTPEDDSAALFGGVGWPFDPWGVFLIDP